MISMILHVSFIPRVCMPLHGTKNKLYGKYVFNTIRIYFCRFQIQEQSQRHWQLGNPGQLLPKVWKWLGRPQSWPSWRWVALHSRQGTWRKEWIRLSNTFSGDSRKRNVAATMGWLQHCCSCHCPQAGCVDRWEHARWTWFSWQSGPEQVECIRAERDSP